MKKILTYLTITLVLLLCANCSKDKEEPVVIIPTNLTVDKTSINTDAAESIDAVVVSSNKDWKAEVDADWIALSVKTGQYDSKIKIDILIMANANTDTRKATITIKADDKTATITVEQKGRIIIPGIAFADAKFKQYLAENFDTNDDGEISTEEAEAVTSINCSGKGIESLSGIEYFINLDTLNCSSNAITKISLDKNLALTVFNCDSNKIDSLGISQNSKLKKIYCSSNQLETLDISKNTALSELDCSSNKIASLDISKNQSLTTLFCQNNGLTTLDVSQNGSLSTLDCTKNPNLAKISLAKDQTIMNLTYDSDITKLEYPAPEKKIIHISDSNFKTYLTENFDTDKDGEISEEEGLAIKEIKCQNKEIKSLSGIEYFTNLESLICNTNKLTSIDVSKNLALKTLECGDNSIGNLDISKNTELESLRCYNCALSILNVKNNTKLKFLNCISNLLKNIDLTNNPLLENLYCQRNQLSSLDLRKNLSISVLSCRQNPNLTVVYLEEGVVLKETYIDTPPTVIIYPNYLTIKDDAFKTYLLNNFDVNKDGKLSSEEANNIKAIDCSNIGISSLEGIKNFTNLSSLTCSGNNLTTVDISSNTALTTFACDSNQISELDVSKNTKLVTLNCSKNALMALELSTNKDLQTLICNDNTIFSLSLTSNTKLETLLCQNNNIAYTMYLNNNIHLKKLNCTNNPKLARVYLKAGQTLEEMLYDSESTVIKYLGEEELTIEIPDAKFKEYLVKNFDKNEDGEISRAEAEAITSIDCSSMGISSISGIEYCKNIHTLNCSNNNLTSLPLSSNIKIVTLNCFGNKLYNLDVSELPSLSGLNCGSNYLTSIELSKNTALRSLNCSYNNLTTLTVRSNPLLNTLVCTNNPNLTTVYLTASQNPSIQKDSQTNIYHPTGGLVFKDLNFEYYLLLNFDKNNDGAISTSEADAVTDIDCSHQGISSLEGIDQFSNLSALNCSYNNLTTIDVSSNIKLSMLYCNDNKLTTLSLPVSLTWLYCPGNLFTTLDVKDNTAITVLDCTDNPNLTKVIVATEGIKNIVIKDDHTEVEVKP